MKIMPLQKRYISDSRLVLGCMGLGGQWNKDPLTDADLRRTQDAVETALSIGITMFDHADIYCRGKSEEAFGRVLKGKPGLREQIVLQSKCGIRLPEPNLTNRFDFSKEHILCSVDGILSRLQTDYLDILLLHRPDLLIEPEEVAEAFDVLKKSGKVRHFGVSNMTAAQMKLIQAHISEPLVANQLEMSLNRLDWLEQAILVNQKAGAEMNFADGIIEYCRMEDVQIQAWAPLAYGMYSGKTIENPSEAVLKTRTLVEKMAAVKETTAEAIVLGWLMRHPAMIQPVIGTSNPQRIRNCQDATRESELMTRDEWYTLFTTSRGKLLP